MLAGWADIERHLGQAFSRTRVLGDAVEVTFDGPQVVEVTRLGTWVRVAGVIGSMRHVSQLDLLGNNVNLVVGAYCLKDGALALRQTIPMRGLAAADLEDTVRAVALQAAWTRKVIAEL